MIIGISGKKQSGKSTLNEFMQLNKILGDTSYKTFEMAEPLKEMIVNIMDVDPKLVYGSDEEKNQFSQYKWKDLPHFPELLKEWSEKGKFPKNEFMSGREVMQQVGTNIFRRMNGPIWANAAVKKMLADAAEIKSSCDIRFPDEVYAVQKAGGIVIRLTKCKDEKDAHHSELALDPDVFRQRDFDVIINNVDMDINEKNTAFMYALSKLEIIQVDEDNTLYNQYMSDHIIDEVTICR